LVSVPKLMFLLNTVVPLSGALHVKLKLSVEFSATCLAVIALSTGLALTAKARAQNINNPIMNNLFIQNHLL